MRFTLNMTDNAQENDRRGKEATITTKPYLFGSQKREKWHDMLILPDEWIKFSPLEFKF